MKPTKPKTGVQSKIAARRRLRNPSNATVPISIHFGPLYGIYQLTLAEVRDLLNNFKDLHFKGSSFTSLPLLAKEKRQFFNLYEYLEANTKGKK